MELLRQKIQEGGTNLASLDLEYKKIDNLDPLMPMLAQLYNLQEVDGILLTCWEVESPWEQVEVPS